jgi:hypothetical protein
MEMKRFIYWDPHVNPSYVADAHLSNPPTSIKYASVVSRESVHVAFRITALGNIDVEATDILNTYLASPCDGKVWTILGPEFGPELEGKRAIIVRSLYGLKSSGEAYRYHIATYAEHLGFTGCKADPEVWIREKNDHAGAEFYESVLIYSDEVLANGKDPSVILSRMNKGFTWNEGTFSWATRPISWC